MNIWGLVTGVLGWTGLIVYDWKLAIIILLILLAYDMGYSRNR